MGGGFGLHRIHCAHGLGDILILYCTLGQFRGRNWLLMRASLMYTPLDATLAGASNYSVWNLKINVHGVPVGKGDSCVDHCHPVIDTT